MRRPIPHCSAYSLFQPRPCRSTRKVGLRKRAVAHGFAIAMIAARSGPDGRLSSGEWSLEREPNQMSHELSFAQNHAWNLARTLMTRVILFKVDEDEYGVLPADDLDGEGSTRYSNIALHRRPAGSLNRLFPQRAAKAAGRKGSCAAAMPRPCPFAFAAVTKVFRGYGHGRKAVKIPARRRHHYRHPRRQGLV